MEKQTNSCFYLQLNNRGFYITVNHSLWIDLRLTEILLLVKNLHLGLHYFNRNMKQKASKDPMMFIKKFENVLLDCYGDHKDPRRKAHLQEIY